jgi:signal transduction histidine kinase
VGAFAANVSTAGTVATSLGIAAGNTAEALLGSFLATRFAGGTAAFDRPANIFRWTLWVALLSTTVSATIGVASLAMGGNANRADLGSVWLTWWLGDAGGALGVAPFLILWAKGTGGIPSRGRLPEALGLGALLWVLGETGFGVPLGVATRTYPLGFAFLPLLAWAAFRLGARATVTVALGVSVLSVWGTIRGHGPFALADPNTSLILVQAFLAVTTTTALALAAAVEERARAERELQELNRDLETRVARRTAELKEALTDLEGFSYTVAHDLRAPLRALAGFSGFLREEYGPVLDAKGREYVERIENAARRMDELVQDLLSYSKLTREQIRLERTDVGELIREVRQQMEPEIQERHAEIRVESRTPEVMAHRVMLSQALTNLIGNALKFVDPGVVPEIRISAEARDGTLRLWVSDNGIGIPPDCHQRIFDIFTRLEPGRFPGTGIGLAIVRKALDRMGGACGVESAPGKGSRFWIELPIAARQTS